ncbi:MAG: hypothetical protein PF961_24140 [Planctomycetota bacterium]|nr:hypothetical protein [Planctomycetota bacterium]
MASCAAADQWDPPPVAKEFRGSVTVTVKWVHNSTWWLMMDVTSLKPTSGDAAHFKALTTLPKGLKIGLRWHGPGQPDPAQHAWLKGLKPQQAITIELEPSGQGNGLRLAAVPTGEDAAMKAEGDGSQLGPGVFVPPEQRGAQIDEGIVQHRFRVDPNDPQAFATVSAAWPAVRAKLEAGEACKLVLSPGVHRGSWGLIEVTDAIRDTLLVIEGAGKGATVWAGSELYGLERWTDLGDGLVAADWGYDWGNHAYVWETPKPAGHRSEMVFVDGDLMTQVLIEAYDYQRSGRLMDHGKRKHSWDYQRLH